MSSMPQIKPQVNDSIPFEQLRLALETVDAAAKAYYKAPSKYIKNELLTVIEAALPEGYVEYTTSHGITVIRLDDQIPPPRIHLCIERIAESDLCPGCGGDLLTGGEVVDRYSRHGETVLTVMCRSCQQFVRVRERGRL